MKPADKLSILAALILALALAGCDRMITSRNAQLVKDADAKVAQGDFLRAINLYEAALDDSPHCADVHYKLALLYDDKMKDPLNALHHFKRYLVLSPNGVRANEVRNFLRHDEIALLTTLSGDAVVTRAEAARLRNENLNLRRELEERSGKTRGASEKTPPLRGSPPPATTLKGPGRKTYVVQPGDTLASISRKFYKTSARWKEILAANKNEIEDAGKLKIGQSLVIP